MKAQRICKAVGSERYRHRPSVAWVVTVILFCAGSAACQSKSDPPTAKETTQPTQPQSVPPSPSGADAPPTASAASNGQAASPDGVRQQACEQTFKALVGDINDKNWGRSIAGRIQALNVGLRQLKWSGKGAEQYATEIRPIVTVLRKNEAGFLTYCRGEMTAITSPCDPYGFGTEEYGLCIRERLPEFSCFTDRGPWSFLLTLPRDVVTSDQRDLAEFMKSAADARAYCHGHGGKK